jgi:c-di-GMP-related signal transduction protein
VGNLLCIVSIFSGLIDVELDFVCKELSLSHDIQQALVDHQGKLGHCYSLCLKIESGDFIGLQEIQKQLNLQRKFIL